MAGFLNNCSCGFAKVAMQLCNVNKPFFTNNANIDEILRNATQYLEGQWNETDVERGLGIRQSFQSKNRERILSRRINKNKRSCWRCCKDELEKGRFSEGGWKS